MKTVLFFLSDFRIGMTSLLCHQAVSLSRNEEINFHFISGDKEQVPGLSGMLKRNSIDPIIFEGLDEHSKFFEKAKGLNDYIGSLKPDYIHVQNNWQLILMFFVKTIYHRRFKIIYTIHGYRHNFRFKSYLFRYLLTLMLMLAANKVVAASSFVRKKFRLIKPKTAVIFLGVDDCYFLPASPPKVSSSRINIIFAGQFRTGKNQDKLIRAFHQFLEKSNDNSFYLTLPGEGYLRESCIQLSKDLHLEDRIFFPGQLNRQEICDLYAKSNISVIPSNVETFGHCIAEPFVLGLCVLTSDTGIASDLIKNEENGFIFKDFNDLVEILQKLAKNPDLISDTGKKAYAGRDQLRWQSITEKMLELYV